MEKIQNIPFVLPGNPAYRSILKYCFILVIFCVLLSGCDHNNRILDPSQIGRFRPVPAVNVILDSLGVEDEDPSAFEGAEEPLPSDIIEDEFDYTFSPGDILRVQIFELLADNSTFTQDYVINETGKIHIMEVGVIEAAGLTERQLEEEIRNILRPNLLKEPLVNVTLFSSQKRVFSVSGQGVRTSGRFPIPRYDYRLLDAIAQAGGVGQFNVSYIYVTRRDRAVRGVTQPIDEELLGPIDTEPMYIPEQDMLRMIMPRSEGESSKGDDLVMTSSEMVTDKELLGAVSPGGIDLLSEISDFGAGLGQAEEAGRVEWIFRDGKWVPVEVGRRPVEIGRIEEEPFLPYEYEWEAEEPREPKVRLIKIPTDKLMAGDPKYNIVIREGDAIHIPVDVVGEFYVMGNVNRVGAFVMTGRPLTLKMAMAVAGGLGPLAWPKHCEVTRRIGKDKEETVMVNLDKIARGDQPDFFIKPHDLINVGTHPTSFWRASLRTAFRSTYGFAFIYDRNFAVRDFGEYKPLNPTRWDINW